LESGFKNADDFSKKSPKFGGIGEDRIKKSSFFEFKFKNFEKIKKSGKIILKNRSNSKNIGGDFFSNLDRFVG
jgi:hypothetical protein